MKLRCGFVSNSSSSSFMIIGCPLNTDQDNFFSLRREFRNDFDFYDGDGWRFVAGIDGYTLLQEYTIPQAKEIVKQKLIEKIPLDKQQYFRLDEVNYIVDSYYD